MKKSIPKLALVSALTSIHIWQSTLVRPVADDYTLLNIYSNDGFAGLISFFWNTFGGNISPVIIRAIFLSISIDGTNWFGFAAFSLFTSLLVVIAYFVVIAWLTDRRLRQLNKSDLIVGLLASLVFEGLFTPGLSSAYLFGAASGVHLWPICIFILTLKLVSIASDSPNFKMRYWFIPILFTLGFIIGNSGIAEAAAIIFALSTFLRFKNRFSFVSNLKLDSKAIYYVFLGSLIGFVTIFIAPGFKSRNQNVGSADFNFSEFVINFRSSAVSFSGELITHPIWILALLSLFVASNLRNSINDSKAKILCLGFAVLFLMLIMGSTFGYAAWHQSSGLIFMFTPALICFIATIVPKYSRRNIHFNNASRVLIPLLVLLLAFLAIRGLNVQEIRSSTWDRNLILNICSLKESIKEPLKGAEIKYWPIGLGIEDVNRWDWMSKDYVSWLTKINPQFEANCKNS